MNAKYCPEFPAEIFIKIYVLPRDHFFAKISCTFSKLPQDRFCTEWDFYGCGHFSFVFIYFLTLVTFTMEERHKVGYEQTGPLPLPISWAAHKHCVGQRMSAPYLDQSSRCPPFSVPHENSNFQLPCTFSNTSLTNVFVEQVADGILS